MEKCSSFPDDSLSPNNIRQILHKLQKIGFCADLDPIPDSSRFEQILSVFLKELHCKREIRPFPAMIGDGRPIDLHKLFLLVLNKGGFNSVTGSKIWPVVAEEIGLDLGFGCALKLIYAKYLSMLERCLMRVPANGCEGNVGVLMRDSECEVRGLYDEIVRQENVGLGCSGRGREEMLVLDDGKCVRRGGKGGSFFSAKRKRESLVGMLNWVRSVAKNPVFANGVKIVPADGMRDVGSSAGLQYSLAFRARKVLFLQRFCRGDGDASASQNGQKMHPFIYEDCNGAANPSLQTSRCTQSNHSPDKPSCCGSCSKASTVCMGEEDEGHNNNANEANNCMRPPRISALLPDYLACCVLTCIPVGSSFQVKVPAWTSKPETLYDSDDLKWLGKRIWPPEHHDNKQPAASDLIGKGREDSCKCKSPGSVECVRFHVTEKRLQLKCELGAAFHAWRFHFMGEEVALSWKGEEEQRFKAVFHQNQPPYSKDLWKQLHLCFPRKGFTGLVSYYFNVFLLARRCYQNRVNPAAIDSDDEETEFGFLSCNFTYGAMRFRDPRSIICAQNRQCVDLGD